MREFINNNRRELINIILDICSNCEVSDSEIEKWILNDEGLYNWARSEGVNI